MMMKMNSKNTVSISLIALLVSALFLQAEMSIAQDKKADGKAAVEGKSQAPSKPALVVNVIKPQPMSMTKKLQSNGTWRRGKKRSSVQKPMACA
jgi:hypothetical protein